MKILDFRITRFQFPRDRVIGDSQVRADEAHVATLELIGERGETGLGFAQSLFHPLPAEEEIERTFREECWPSIEGKMPRNGCMIRSVARNTHSTNGVLSFALNSSRKKAIARITEQTIAKP